jgi:hypothetical protein
VFAHVENAEEGGCYSCTLVGDLSRLLLGRSEALVVFLRIFVKLQDLGFCSRVRDLTAFEKRGVEF